MYLYGAARFRAFLRGHGWGESKQGSTGAEPCEEGERGLISAFLPAGCRPLRPGSRLSFGKDRLPCVKAGPEEARRERGAFFSWPLVSIGGCACAGGVRTCCLPSSSSSSSSRTPDEGRRPQAWPGRGRGGAGPRALRPGYKGCGRCGASLATMVLTDDDKNHVRAVWANVSKNCESMGAEALHRLFLCNTSTKTYFSHFDLHENSPQMREHGKKVFEAITLAVNNLDDIAGVLSKLSDLHAEKLRVDPVNFPLLAHCILVTIACHNHGPINPACLLSMDKFLNVVSRNLVARYR